MPRSFAITAASNSVFLDEDRKGEARFTVSNQSGRSIGGRARVVTEGAEAESWVSLRGSAHREFATAGTEQYTVEIEVPPDAPSGSYTVRLDMVGEERPDEQYVEGSAVTFEVPEPEPASEPFPWKIVAAVAVLLLIGGGVLAAYTFDIWPFGNDQSTSRTVSGTVVDAGTEERLPNVSVFVATDTTICTETSDDGTYSLEVDSPEDTLVFSFAGYQEKRVEVGEREAINVELLEEGGGIIAWGSDRLGQVSDTPSGSGFVAVAAGSNHSLALHEDNT